MFHAAAYKHVPCGVQPFSGNSNNVFHRSGVCATVATRGAGGAISTDKAVRPTNVMGVKRSELVLQAHAAEGSRTRLSMVRFGNVLGSSGSVVPLFAARSLTVGRSPSLTRRSPLFHDHPRGSHVGAAVVCLATGCFLARHGRTGDQSPG